MNWLLLPLALLLVGIARIGIWLFPEQPTQSKRYEGHFGAGDKGWKSWENLTDAERIELQERGG